MKLRPARLADSSTLAELTTQLGYPTRPQETEERLRDLASQPENAVLVAEDEAAVIGWIHVAGSHSLEMEPCAVILGLVIDESRRGQGTGRTEERARLEPFGQNCPIREVVRPPAPAPSRVAHDHSAATARVGGKA